MTVTDKQADIAILRTLGASPRSIQKIFMVQGALVGIIGTILGTIFRYFAYRFWVFSTKLDQDPDFASSPDQELAFITGQIPVIPQREDKTPRHDDPASHHGNPAPRPEDTVANTLPEQDVRRAS